MTSQPHHHPRPTWRYRMWTICGLAVIAAMILLGMDIGHARIPPGVYDWSLACFALAVIIPCGEWAIRHHIAAHNARVDEFAQQLDTLNSNVEKALHQAYWHGRAHQAIDDHAGQAPVIHLPRNNNRADGRG